MSRPLPPGAPSVEAHAALVDATLALVRRVDPALEPLLVVGWMARRASALGSALFVPAGAWYSATAWRAGIVPHCATAKSAPHTLAILRLSAPRWSEMSARSRGETIAHELAHLSDLRATLGHLPAREASLAWARHSAHGIGWIRWSYRYAGRVLPARGDVRELTGEVAHDHGAVVIENEGEKIYAA